MSRSPVPPHDGPATVAVLLLFASYADALGCASLAVTLPPDARLLVTATATSGGSPTASGGRSPA